MIYRLLYGITYAFRQVQYLFVWLAGVAPQTALPAWFYKALHYFVVAVVVGLFGYFSPLITEPAEVSVTDAVFIQRYFWGLVVLLLYLFVRATIFVVRLLLESDEEFEDIQRAWENGLAAIDRVGLDFQWLPVFLVVGAGDEEDSLFRAARMSWKTTSPGRDEAAPLRIYATDEAIFVSCTTTGVLAAQRSAVPEGADHGGMDRTQRPHDPGATIDPSGMGPADAAPAGGAVATIDPAMWSGGGAAAPRSLAPESMSGTLVAPSAATGTLVPGGGGGSGILAGLQASSVKPSAISSVRPLSQAEIDEASRRLEFLCSLISKARGEFCPINGMLMVLPLSWSALPAGAESDRIVRSAREDLETVYRAFGLAFPATVAITGSERSPGLRQFVDRGMKFNAKFLDSRAGSKFPPGAAVDQSTARWAVDAGLHWFRDWCYSLFSKSLSDATNGQVYRLLCDLQTRRDALARQLQLVFEDLSGPEAARLCGVYYCAAGRSERDRAFVQGVFRKLVDGQDDVAWTTRRLETDRHRRTLAIGGLIVAAALAIVVVYLIYKLFAGE